MDTSAGSTDRKIHVVRSVARPPEAIRVDEEPIHTLGLEGILEYFEMDILGFEDDAPAKP